MMPDPWLMLLGIVFASIGFAYFRYGKKHTNLVARYCGVALMVCPYFSSDYAVTLAIGAGLMLLPKFVSL